MNVASEGNRSKFVMESSRAWLYIANEAAILTDENEKDKK